MSKPGLTNQWEPWQRLVDSIGPYYRTQLFTARERARGELCDLDEEQLATVAAEGRRVASSLDEEGARLTVSLTEDRERHSRLAVRPAARGRTAPSARAMAVASSTQDDRLTRPADRW